MKQSRSRGAGGASLLRTLASGGTSASSEEIEHAVSLNPVGTIHGMRRGKDRRGAGFSTFPELRSQRPSDRSHHEDRQSLSKVLPQRLCCVSTSHSVNPGRCVRIAEWLLASFLVPRSPVPGILRFNRTPFEPRAESRNWRIRSKNAVHEDFKRRPSSRIPKPTNQRMAWEAK